MAADGAVTLQEAFVGRRPAEPALLDIVVGMLDRLQALHDMGRFHRDIAPPTVRIQVDGSVDLGETGSTPLADEQKAAVLRVKPGYAPIEAYQQRVPYAATGDLYAVGAVAYWLMSGEAPPESPARVLDDTLPALASPMVRGNYSDELRGVVVWALQLLPSQRPATAIALRDALVPLRARLLVNAPLAFAPDAAWLASVREFLTGHLLGPVAAAVVGHARRKAADLETFCSEVASHITDADLRAEFLARFSAPQAPATEAPSSPPAARFSPELLAALEAELSGVLGAVARVVVRRAAGRSADQRELYAAIAAEIDDPARAQAFLYWAESTLGD